MEYNPEYQTGIVPFNAILEIAEKAEKNQLNCVEGVDARSRRLFVAALTHILSMKRNEIGVVVEYGYERETYAYELSRMLQRLGVSHEWKGEEVAFDGKSVKFFRASDTLRSIASEVLVLVAPSKTENLIKNGGKIISIK